MIKEVIYKIVEHCECCDQDVTIRLNSDDPDFLKKAPSLKKEILPTGMHEHWVNNHQICAKCGKLVKSGHLTRIREKDTSWPVDKTYLKWVAPKHPYSLIVHKECLDTL